MTSPVRAPRPTPRGIAPVPAPSSRPDLRVVGEPVRRSRAGVWVAASVVVVFAALVMVAMAHSMLVSGQARLDQVNAQVRSERELLQREPLRLADAQSPAHITSEAQRLGMVQTEQPDWLSPRAGGPPAAVPEATDPAESTELASSNDGASIQP